MPIPLDISAFSLRPPHRDRVTSGRSPAESERHSVPLSAAALPTDWGDWVPEVDPWSAPERDVASISLEEEQTSHFLMIFTLFMTCHENWVIFLMSAKFRVSYTSFSICDPLPLS